MEGSIQLNLLDGHKTYIFFHHHEHIQIKKEHAIPLGDGLAPYIKSRFNNSKRNAITSF